jgi:hypothetical protein
MELARSVGRLDWWKIRDEHTPTQWAVQQTAYRLGMFGERRADLRSAVSTASIKSSWAGEPVTEEQFGELVSVLANYFDGKRDEIEVDHEALAKVRGRDGNR